MKQLLNPDTLSNVTEFNQPVVVSGFPDGSVIEEIRVSSLRTDNMPYLVRVDSPCITIKRIIASCPLDLERDGKARWMQAVASGVLVMGDDVTIERIQAVNVHTVVTLRGRNGKVLSGSARKFSGDGVQLVADGCEAKMQFAESLEVFPYDAFHRDIAQLWKYGGGTLKNCKVSATYLHESIAHSPPQGVAGFDGEYENITVHDCQLFGVHQVHGVSFGYARNTIVTNVQTDSLIRFGGRKGEPAGSNNRVIGCEAKDIIFEDGSQARAQASAPTKVHDMEQVPWLASLRNLNAPAITEEDYLAASIRLNCEVAAIKSVFQVEAPSSGYNRDGSLKSLYERHVGRREVLSNKLPLKAITRIVGSALISRFTGGYKGGIAEYWRIGQVVRAIASANNEPDPASDDFKPESSIALEVALRAASWGRGQILGKNCELAGYSTAREMVEELHKSEKAQLAAFVSFVEKTGLDKHLRSKNWLAFAKGYNGQRCCDRGAKKNYAAEIAAAYRQISGQPVEFKPMAQSRTVQGGAVGVVTGAAGITTVVTELQGQVTGVLDKLQEVKGQADSALVQASEIKAQVTDIVASNADLLNIVGDMKWWLYALAGVLAVSLIGNAYSLYARWDDRRNGYK